ncbi:PREDICTED: RCC1 and BTB domain-containing protein 1-like [Trachymyrmex septentrionalis]|uniref:RCC1 and BTB domain-containing protein 1-like n=1 Tax=Trachymyrmex septentrionalis TaxID=34720 RepID=UPI00084EDDE6|nr:PREDICTED: RCC1 and BTB domain-containing protein 1-like [Trachymyrmex septentrionalis]
MDNLKNKCIMFKNIKRLIALKSESKVHYAQRANSSQDINAECKQLHDTFDKSIPTDLVIKVGVRSIYVNKFVLQNCSSYFKKVDRFITSEDGQDVIRLDQFSYVTVYAYLKYIYTGDINLVSLDKKFDLLIMAEKFKEIFLINSCYKKIKEEITKTNIISVYRTAQTYNNKIVQEYCFEFFIENTTHVINTDSFKELDEYTRSTFINKAKEVYGYYKI